MKLPLELTAVTILSVLPPMVLPNSALPIIFTTPRSSQCTEPGPPRISTVFLDHGIAAREYGSLPRSISLRTYGSASYEHTHLNSHHNKSQLMETLCGTPSVLTHGNLVGNTHSMSTHGNLMGNTFAVSTYENFVGRMASLSDRSLEETILIKGDTLVTVTVKAQLSNSHRLLTVRVREALNDCLRAPPSEIHQEYMHSGSCEDYAGIGTRVSPCLLEGLFQALSVLDAVMSYTEV
ncbi:hypothetical protein DFJ58DRAFT_734570 [Suillus subalutaceus]|uniref:uncharacterized protein n=1 Tax=Suillus subalutaceus TaxID=48586 RepID=UPI001B871803|nr:uncharacterized protein DFJ58DRAFT_734570 [Suillus subalutaceus]KAG1837028.1 hypothetical protein DFJ58DRAFT_734570 [Suillus subalutaceus]